MNILYLIGNGFDLSKNLPTNYESFYEYYDLQENANEIIKQLKRSIKSNIYNWSDLEEALGKYVKNIQNKDDVLTIHKSLIEKLKSYLIGIENNFTINADNADNANKILDDLTYPEKMFQPTLLKDIKEFRNQWNNDISINVISFNYTKIFERLIGFDERKNIGKIDNKFIYMNTVQHIHGTIDDGMILGVNDEKQFNNEGLVTDRLILNKFIKSNYNIARRTGHDEQCQILIRDANLVCIFGVSFGVTDLRWWKYIEEKLVNDNNMRLILFIYNSNIDLSLNDAAEIIELEDLERNKFFDLVGTKEDLRESIRYKIYISINSNMFKIDNNIIEFNKDWYKNKLYILKA